MKPPRWWNLRGCAVVVLLVLSGLWYVGDIVVKAPFRAQLDACEQIHEGMTVEEVGKLLGSPDYVFSAETVPADYTVLGYSCKRREISSTLHVYLFGEPIACIWVDAHNRVEDIYVGGS
jgi:hypothetical protein